MRRYLFVTMVVVLVATSIALGRGQSPGGAPTRAWRFEQIAKGVHFATGTGLMTTMSNSMVIENADHLMLVDTSVTPAAARALVAQIKEELSAKPIKYVFNSHYHFDHAHGNQIFGDDVEIIGHEYIRTMHQSNVLLQRTNKSFSDVLPAQIAGMKERIAKTTDSKERAQLEAAMRVTEAHAKAIQEVAPKPPSVTFTDVMTLHKGGREVQVLFLGRGHTGGDTMVFLPAERIVFTGDFFEGRPGGGVLSYFGDAFIDEWPASLERLKALDFDIIVPGHGAPFKERQQITDFQNYIRELWRQAAALRLQGVTAQQAAEKVDMSKFAAQYGLKSPRPDPRAVLRAYEILQLQMPM